MSQSITVVLDNPNLSTGWTLPMARTQSGHLSSHIKRLTPESEERLRALVLEGKTARQLLSMSFGRLDGTSAPFTHQKALRDRLRLMGFVYKGIDQPFGRDVSAMTEEEFRKTALGI